MPLPFCPTCSYYLYTDQNEDAVLHVCRNCGFKKPIESASMVLETNFRSGSSAGGVASGITVNSYTLEDPTLPHVSTIPCPNASCPYSGQAQDVIYIKTDPSNLKFQYICKGCKTQWTN